MEKRRRLIIDRTIAKATWGSFTGDDEHDGKASPITEENFSIEFYRYFAKGLRARWIRLSSAKLRAEARVVRAHFKKPSELAQLAERVAREKAARELRERQAKLGRRSRLQPGILAAASHYRNQGVNAGEAWDAVRKNPFTTVDRSTVEIKGDERSRLEQRMLVRHADGRQQKRAISFGQWRKSYWKAAKPGLSDRRFGT
jgi:hypothetical protein